MGKGESRAGANPLIFCSLKILGFREGETFCLVFFSYMCVLDDAGLGQLRMIVSFGSRARMSQGRVSEEE
jgi:hypothetical protein